MACANRFRFPEYGTVQKYTVPLPHCVCPASRTRRNSNSHPLHPDATQHLPSAAPSAAPQCWPLLLLYTGARPKTRARHPVAASGGHGRLKAPGTPHRTADTKQQRHWRARHTDAPVPCPPAIRASIATVYSLPRAGDTPRAQEQCASCGAAVRGAKRHPHHQHPLHVPYRRPPQPGRKGGWEATEGGGGGGGSPNLTPRPCPCAAAAPGWPSFTTPSPSPHPRDGQSVACPG